MHIGWTVEQWNMDPFRDESKFNLFGSDGKRFVRRENGERLSQCIKKTMIVWEMISSAGVGPIVRFHGNINVSVYKELLRLHAFLYLRKGTVETLIFRQDNAPCHKGKTVLSFLEEERIAVMKWPPQSPDTNPIENVWNIRGEKAHKRNHQNIDYFRVFWKKNGKVSLPPFVRS